MGAKAPQPAPNRLPDGTIDPTYRKPEPSPPPPPKKSPEWYRAETLRMRANTAAMKVGGRHALASLKPPTGAGPFGQCGVKPSGTIGRSSETPKPEFVEPMRYVKGGIAGAAWVFLTGVLAALSAVLGFILGRHS